MAPFSTQPPQEPALQQLGVEPVGFRPAMFPRYRDTRGMDHVSLDATCRKPARQPETVAAGFEGNRNARDRAPGSDRLILPAMQQTKQPFWARLDDGYDRAILVQGDEGPAQVVRLGHLALHQLNAATKLPSSPPAP